MSLSIPLPDDIFEFGDSSSEDNSEIFSEGASSSEEEI